MFAIRRRIEAGVIGALLLTQLATPAPARAEALTRTVTLIHLNDLHANLVPHLDLERVVPADGAPASMRVAERGGIARIATLVARIRDENPDAVLMNVGDTYHGGVEALYTRGNAIVPAVNALGIDVGVPGNWDFAYGGVTTRMRYSAEPAWPARFLNWLIWGEPVERPNFPNLAANLTQTLPPMARGDLLLPATLLRDVGGVRVGFIGLTSDMVPRMAKPFEWGFDFLQGEENYRELIDREVAKLREEGAEVVVVMSELGLHRDHRLAGIVKPGVDVFFSAHTHEVTLVPLDSASGAVVVEAGNDGFLGRMDLAVREGAVVGRSWRVIPVDASVPDDPRVLRLVDQARAPFLAPDVDMELPAPWVELPLTRPIDTVVGRVDRLLHRRNSLENPFNAMLAEVIRQVAGTQIAMTPGFRFDAVVPPREEQSDSSPGASGEITLEQLYRFLPIAPSLAVGEIRGEDLRDIVELELTRVFSADPFQHSGGWFGSFGGLEIEVDLAQPDGERILRLHLSGSEQPIRDDEILTVASCVRPFDEDGVMCSNPAYLEVTELENPATGRAWSPLELLANAFETGSAPVAPNSRVDDRGGIALWPQGRFIQPVH
ncbi:MAG: 5'-nucleotidase C-terminal domain-containing protein [Deltaproteobacteria bacterium]|nr:5'-nucleotidase C-terminal domain-containing protein [Deltaproteobacteria bacterium]MBW2415249.1 5'-nucleotidase C-terminal domain-containing protein [Deltaproteobacteria bacterium]